MPDKVEEQKTNNTTTTDLNVDPDVKIILLGDSAVGKSKFV